MGKFSPLTSAEKPHRCRILCAQGTSEYLFISR
jgi:hypothetical protein